MVDPIGSGDAHVLPRRVDAFNPPPPPPLIDPVTVRSPKIFVFPRPSTDR